MIVHTFAQYSPAWWEARRGKPTASEFNKICTPKTMKLSEQRIGYMHQLIADSIHFDPNCMTEGPMTAAMRNGSNCEPEARRFYEYHTQNVVEQVGFVTTDDERFGVSPDGLIPKGDGGLELKCPTSKIHIGYILGAELPVDYKCQVHGQLIIAERKWVDFLSYCPGYEPFLIRVEPDDFTVKLREMLELFWTEYKETLKRFVGQYTANPSPAYNQEANIPDFLGGEVVTT